MRTLVKCRHVKQAKDADKLEPKGTVAGRSTGGISLVDIQRSPADRADLTHSVIYAEHGKPDALPLAVGSRKARR